MRLLDQLRRKSGNDGVVEPEIEKVETRPVEKDEKPAVIVMKSTHVPSIQLWSNVFLSNWFFVWVFAIVARARRGVLKFALRKQESAQVNVDALENAWNHELKQSQKEASVFRALHKVFGFEFWMIAIYKLVWSFFTWAAAWYLLKRFLQYLGGYVKGKTRVDFVDNLTEAHSLAILLFVASLFSSIAIHQQYAECNRVAIKVRAAVTGLVYRKSLRLSRVKGGAGEVINILSTDVTRINEAVLNFHFLWGAFVEVTLILGLAFYEIGISALPALGWVILLLPIQMYLGKRTNEFSRDQTKATTERVHLMSELLTAIKLIKFYAWERPFDKKISDMRTHEMKLIFDSMVNKSVNYTVVFAIPVLAALTSLGMFVAINDRAAFTASLSFTVLSLFNTLRYPFFMLPMAVKSTAGALTSFSRLNVFLQLDEVVPLLKSEAPEGCQEAFHMEDSDFKWDGAESDLPTIRGISISAKKGSKIAIVGDVGCGKSSVLAALLGQIRQVRGETVRVYGTTAYMSQEAWLLNLTLRDNVTFGQEFQTEKYKEVIRVCSLQRDLTLLLSGDRTEIAERGANLSGGQRQRVSLARAVYYDADIILMDDPLSAVDQHVGRHIFEECILKYLANKTVVIVMNQLQYLQQMDHVIYLSNGSIKSQGTFSHLMESDIEFNNLVTSHVVNDAAIIDNEFEEEEPMNDASFDPTAISSSREVHPVEVPHGTGDVEAIMSLNSLSIANRDQLSSLNQRVNESTVRSMIERQNRTSILGDATDVAELMSRNEASRYSVIPEASALKTAQEQAETDDAEAIRKGKLVVEDESAKAGGLADFVEYARSGSGVPRTIGIVFFFLFVHCIRLGGDFWLRLWVPRTGGYSDGVYIGVYGAFTACFTIGVFARGYIFTAITSFKAFDLHNNLFQATVHAPMSFFDTTPVARILAAFSKHQLHVDDTMPDAGLQALQYFPLGLGALIFCSVLIEYNWAPSIFIVFLGAILISVTQKADFATKSLEATTKPPIFSHLTSTLEGLFSIRAYHAQARFDAMNLVKLDDNHGNLFAMQCVKSLQALYLDILSSVVIYMSALLLIFARNQDQIDSIAGLALSNALQMLVFVQWTVRQWGEVETQMASVRQLVYYGKTPPEAPFEIPENKPPPSWPKEGLIRFKNIELKYQKNGVSVLKNINCTIHPQEKIGIVGRTGSGKSTLLVSLLRIVESCDGLHDLRNKIAIIPQEPVLFVGTIRSNLDPFFNATDDEIWKALDAVTLGDKLRALPNKLDTEVSENGKSVSQGQRQLICIARAILCKAKVLVLDEATASLDAQTDLLIQETIKKNFAELTMLTIAHRLNTIIECDRVLVMDAGKILEFDEPYELLKNPEGSFRALVEQTGPGASQVLTETATKAHEKRVSAGYKFPPKENLRGDAPITLNELANRK